MLKQPEFTSKITCKLVGSFASDLAVVNAARISFDTEHAVMDENDSKLIDYLLRNKHGSPFEHGYFKFLIDAPIFVFRQHMKHRAGHSNNEMSGRYTELESKFYVPERFRVQEGRPGAYTYRDADDRVNVRMRYLSMKAYEEVWRSYQFMLEEGVAKEHARAVLPTATYSKVIWSCNPRSLMHYLGLRAKSDAQAEIQQVAEGAEKALAYHMPITYDAFVRNGRVAP